MTSALRRLPNSSRQRVAAAAAAAVGPSTRLASTERTGLKREMARNFCRT